MKLSVSHPPHIKQGTTVKTINWSKIAILVAVSFMAVIVFGLSALAMILVSAISAVITEAGIQKLSKQELTIKDGDAVSIGILIALLLPPTDQLWIPAIGAFFGVALVKHAFGGLGSNLFNPAIAAWVFMNMSWGALTNTKYVSHIGEYSDLILEFGAGRLAEVSSIVLIIGGLYLIYKKYIDWRVPSSFLFTTIALAVLIGEDLSYVVTGMLFLGVFILATETATSPITKNGRFIYGLLCGVLTVLYGFISYNYVVAVLYAIFIANAFSPFIEKNTSPRPVDEVVL
ncbi:MAG: RnfABCDGE type electron transport complex subunit D [Methanosarcinales archaeon]|nr:RnfABCDGE type electron transport complex subunit D [ANME-2 cluster archaeon]MDW7777223.1 RnfABCDGE type electron transport complex subunit D [Methanosarcinales archaeon]